MNIKEYNNLQVAIMKKYKYKCLLVNNSVEFYKLCSRISQYRQLDLCYSTIKSIIKEVKKERELSEGFYN